MKWWATITKSGTAMHESLLCDEEYRDERIRAQAEKAALRAPDVLIPLVWVETDAFDDDHEDPMTTRTP